MTVYIFVSGPTRPTAGDVLRVIRTIKSRVGECKVWFSTWETTEPLDEIAAEVDKCIVSPQPATDQLKAMTTQAVESVIHRHRRPDIYKWLMQSTPGIFLSRKGITKLFEVGECKDDDIVIRIRSDVLFLVDPAEIQKMIAEPNYYYVIDRKGSGVHFDEWFGLSTYANMKKVWCFTTLEEHEAALSASFNGEDMIRRAVLKNDIPIMYIDETKIDISLLRPNGVAVRY